MSSPQEPEPGKQSAVHSKDLLVLQKEFLAGVSHEMRTPLSVIMGYIQILKEETLGPLNAQQKKSLETISVRAEDLLRVVTHLLAIRDIQAGKKTLRLEPLDLRALLIERLGKSIRDKTRKHMTLDQVLGGDEIWVRGDAQRLGEVIDNLLLNAYKFGPEQSAVRVDLSTDGRSAEVRVRNSGSTITEEERHKLFEPFTATNRGLTREHNGLGLGLFLGKEILADHGGAIFAEAPKGTTDFIIRFTLPLCPRPTASAAAAEKSTRRVLVIEDDMDFLQLVVIYLSRTAANIETSSAESGAAAMQDLAKQLPDLIILDLMLPGMDGLSILGRLKHDAKTANIPVLIVTGHEASAHKAAQAGADDVLIKPFDEALFAAKVGALLSKNRKTKNR